MKNKTIWCIVCGEKVGQCEHNSGTTNNISSAYRIWIKRKHPEVLNSVDKED